MEMAKIFKQNKQAAPKPLKAISDGSCDFSNENKDLDFPINNIKQGGVIWFRGDHRGRQYRIEGIGL